MRIGFIGLGKMGRPMARRLLEADHRVVLFNRTRRPALEMRDAGACVASTPAVAADGSDVVVTMVSDDTAVEEVVGGEGGVAAGLREGGIHCCMSTVSVDLSRRLAELHGDRDQPYVAAPVFGRPREAERGDLWVVAGGDPDAVDRCTPVFDAVGRGVSQVGPSPEKAHVVKVSGNFLLAAAIEALGEATALVQKHGVDPEAFLETVNGQLFRSPVYEGYGGMIARGDYEPAGFELRHGLKDTRLVLEAGDEADVPLPVASVVRDRFLTAMARGWGGIDWAGLGRVAGDAAGLTG